MSLILVQMSTPRKVVLLGQAMSGKSKSVQILLEKINGNGRSRIQGNDINNWHYVATLGTVVTPVRIRGFDCDLWDTAGNPTFWGFRDGYVKNADYVVIFQTSEEDVTFFTEICGNIPYIIIGDINDLENAIYGMVISHK